MCIRDSLRDLANRPAFLGHFTDDFRLTRLESTGIGAGARFRIAVPLGPLWIESVVTGEEAPSRIDERGKTGRGGRTPTAIAFDLAEAGDGMTLLTVHFWTDPTHPLDRLKESLGAEAWHRRQWRRALRRLGDLLESGEGAGERVVVAGGNAVPTGVP